ncbi:HNH endonuclease [[Phormidium] sp. LEGE 05292]|uniref:HNH endonuclease n=1 Tax=[Phormidium] sp. LEGE 05292 TaxID=767427 RepID=UPI001D14FBEA|nr:HNH endonuclease [Phormidium sp. LEGE 05292]
MNAPPPIDAFYYYGIANKKRIAKLYQEAVEDYSRAIELQELSFAYSQRGDVYLQLGEYEKAIQDYTQAINDSYHLSINYEKRGLAYLSWGDELNASLDLKKSAERFLHYGNEGKYNNLLTQVRKISDEIVEEGRKKADKQDYMGAIENYNQAIQIDPDNRKASDYLKIAQLALKQDQEIAAAQKLLDTEEFFTPKTSEEANERNIISIARRQGQYEFRKILLEAYNYRCAITEFDVQEALEAAHIIPYIATENNHPSNGLLLRADLHTLFDLNLITIDPEKLEVILDPRLRESSYRQLHGKLLQLPKDQLYWPKKEALKWRFEQCNWCI